MTKLTIVTVVYNDLANLKRTVESVKKQLVENVEYLIIDGASSDGTLEYLKEIELKYDIKFISERDCGIYDAMNKGLFRASGKWIYYLNSGDILLNNTLKKFLSALEMNGDSDAVYGNIILTTYYKDNMYYKCKAADINIKHLRKSMICSHQAIICKKSKMLEIGGFDCSFKIAGDWNLISRIYSTGGKFSFINEYIAAYDKNGVSSKPHIMESHRVRKNNKFYKWIDLYFVRDLLHDIKSVSSNKILGSKKIWLLIKVRRYIMYDGEFKF